VIVVYVYVQNCYKIRQHIYHTIFLSGGIFPPPSSDSEACYIVAKKLVYQSQVMAALRIMRSCDIENVMVELQEFVKCFTN
jgi:hypothetical protein